MLKLLEEKAKLFWSLLLPMSFLVAFALWMNFFWPNVHGREGFFQYAMIAFIASIFTTRLVAVGIIIMTIQACCLIDVLIEVSFD